MAARSRATPCSSRARRWCSTFRAPTPLEAEPDDIPLDVVYEDEDVLIVDKPAGLVTHPAPGHARGTLVNALLARGGAEAYGAIAGVNRRASSIAWIATPAA